LVRIQSNHITSISTNCEIVVFQFATHAWDRELQPDYRGSLTFQQPLEGYN
jgi:hypothetical protein